MFDMKGMNAVEYVAGHASELDYDMLSPLAIKRAGQVIVDTICCALGARDTDLGKLAAEYAMATEPGNEAILWGTNVKLSSAGAAWANAVASKHLGMDDSHRICGHVAAELVPLAIAICEQRGLTGKDLVRIVAAGYDVFGAIQPGVKVAQRVRGLDHKSQAGTLASAVVAALAMDLGKDKVANALALSMDMASGTEQYVFDAGLCDTKDLLSGFAVRNGIYAAQLSAAGFQGPPGALDGEYGYYHAFGDGYDQAFLANLGKDFTIAETGFKPHAGCRHVHACVDATNDLLSQGKPDLSEVAKIRVGSYKNAITPSFRVKYDCDTVNQAGFSLPVTVSVVLNKGSWYKEDIASFDQPEVQELVPKVEVVLDEQINSDWPEKNGCVVEVTTNGGDVYKGHVSYALGEPENMLSDEEFESKFRYLAKGVISEDNITALCNMVDTVGDIDDVSELVKLTLPDK
tara:strand:+ start:8653 stop:10032 length:1380 start_codon:yes stop_codon:yes gene_type:complete